MENFPTAGGMTGIKVVKLSVEWGYVLISYRVLEKPTP